MSRHVVDDVKVRNTKERPTSLHLYNRVHQTSSALKCLHAIVWSNVPTTTAAPELSGVHARRDDGIYAFLSCFVLVNPQTPCSAPHPNKLPAVPSVFYPARKSVMPPGEPLLKYIYITAWTVRLNLSDSNTMVRKSCAYAAPLHTYYILCI